MSPVAKAHFELRGMRIDVDLRRVDLHEQHERRMPAVEHHVAIAEADRAADEPVAQHAAVQIEVLEIGLRARVGRLAQPAGQATAGRLVLDVQRVGDELIADDLRDATLADRRA